MVQTCALLALGAAAGVSAARCLDIQVPMSLTARNAVFKLDTLTTELDTTNFALSLARNGGNLTDDLLTGYADVSGQYIISAHYCEPDNGAETIQILTHGIGFDSSYWHNSFNNYDYSYVQESIVNRGIATLSYDRLGVGKSSKGEANNEIQIFLEIAALAELTRMIRGATGCFAGVVPAYEKVVHVGHSFGASITYNLINTYPELSDGAILQGFSHIGNFLPFFVLGSNFIPVGQIPALASLYPEGYVGAANVNGVHIDHFGEGDFDPALLQVAFETGQPTTPGELLTVGYGVGVPNNFEGPVMVITGDRDVPFCGGDCSNTMAINASLHNLIEASAAFFEKASLFNATVIPLAGHGLNYHYSHTLTYDIMLDFVDANV